MRIWFWVIGIVTSGVGLLLARVVPRLLDQPALQVAAYLVGVALALAGLIIIVFGVARANKKSSDDSRNG